MTYTDKLISFHIVENENNRNYLTWTYPSLTEEHKKLILSNSFASGVKNEYICTRSSNTWFYIEHFATETSCVAIVVLAKEFEPNKYRQLCDILGNKYSKCQNPVELVNLYLNLYISGVCSYQENGKTRVSNFKNFESVANLKDFIQSFDLEIILLYTAILLKRRVLLFDTNVELLLNDLLAVTNLVPCRKTNDYLYPLVNNSNKLKGLSFFVAGTTNKELIKSEDLYDLFVNMPSREITISPKAEEIMSMTKTHKDIATFLVKIAASDLSEKQLKVQISQKTQDLLDSLKSLASFTAPNNIKMVTMNDLKSKKYHPNLENFLFNLALSENMMML